MTDLREPTSRTLLLAVQKAPPCGTYKSLRHLEETRLDQRRCLIYYVSSSLNDWQEKKGDFCNDSIHLSLLFFFTDGLQVPFESPFSRREVAALKFLPFQRAHLFASGIPIVIREPTVRQSGQHRYVSVNRDSCTHHKNPSRR